MKFEVLENTFGVQKKLWNKGEIVYLDEYPTPEKFFRRLDEFGREITEKVEIVQLTPSKEFRPSKRAKSL